jgi:hypothetical protein
MFGIKDGDKQFGSFRVEAALIVQKRGAMSSWQETKHLDEEVYVSA